MSREVLDDVMVKGACQGKADAVVNCQCNIESAPVRCEQAENCMFYSYYKCSKQWKRLAQDIDIGYYYKKNTDFYQDTKPVLVEVFCFINAGYEKNRGFV